MGKKVKEFKAGDFIFAKVKGYPAWPARIQRLNGKKYFIYFYGTGEMLVFLVRAIFTKQFLSVTRANLAHNVIFDYAEYKHKFLNKTIKRKDFNDGVKQIEYDFANNISIEEVLGGPVAEFLEACAAECSALPISTSDVHTEPTQKEPCILTKMAVESLLPTKEINKNVKENEKENQEASKSRKTCAKHNSGSGNSSKDKNKKKHINNLKWKRIRFQSDSEEDDLTTTKSKNNGILNRSWKSIYRKKIVCRFCGKHFLTKRTFKIHLSSHSNLVKQYNAVIKQHCMVTLNKIDCLPNITGSNKNVAVFNGTIISDKGNSTFYHTFVIDNETSSGDESLYTPKEHHKTKRLRVDFNSSTDIETTQSMKNKKKLEPEPTKLEKIRVLLRNKENNKNKTNAFETSSSVKDPYVPRIKCKPVSELMPQTSQNFNNNISSNVPLVVTQPVITINQPLFTLTPHTGAVSHFQNSVTPTIENTILQSVNNMLHPANSTHTTINVISQPLNGISEHANPLVGPEYPISGLPNAVIQLSDSVIQSNGSASMVAGVVSQPVLTQQLPPWSRTSSQGVPVVPTDNSTNAPLILKTEKAAQPSTALTQTASTPAPPTPVPPADDSKNTRNHTTTIEAYEEIMNSIYLPNVRTSKPAQYFRDVLIMHDLNLLIEPNTVLSEKFVCLVKFKLDVKKNCKSVMLGLSLQANQNQFCIKVREPNLNELNIESLPAFWQMMILKSFLGQVAEKIINCAKKISLTLHDSAKQFLSLLKSIELKNWIEVSYFYYSGNKTI